MKLKNIIVIATLYATLTHSSELFIRPAQQKDIPGIVALDKEVTDEFFTLTMTAGYPELFANNKDLLDKLNNEWDEYIGGILKDGTSMPNGHLRYELNFKN
jgi:hypothetical protein